MRRTQALVTAAIALLCSCSPGPDERPGPSAPDLPPPRDMRVAFLHDEKRTRAGGPIEWTTRWILTWDEVPGATGYMVEIGTSEGVANTARRHERSTPQYAIDVAAGTSAARRLELDRRTQLMFTASHLKVRVAATRFDGALGAPSNWVPVGEVPMDGVPTFSGDVGHGHP